MMLMLSVWLAVLVDELWLAIMRLWQPWGEWT